MDINSKFNVDDVIAYNGNIYKITGIEGTASNYRYNVDCLQNVLYDDTPCTTIGMLAESYMKPFKFDPSILSLGKELWIKKAVTFLKEQDEMIGISFTDDFIERFKQHMESE